MIFSDHSEISDYSLDVDYAYPGIEEYTNGFTVRKLRSNLSWVKNDVNQFGFYLP